MQTWVAARQALDEISDDQRMRDGSRILAAVHETAQDLHAAGFIDERPIRHFDALGLDPIAPYTGETGREDRSGRSPGAKKGVARPGAGLAVTLTNRSTTALFIHHIACPYCFPR